MKKLWILVAALLVAVAIPAVSFAQNVGYDGGFFMKNDEETFKLKMNGRVQTKFFFEKQTGLDKVLSWQMRRAQIGFNATLHDIVNTGFVLKHAIGNAADSNFQTVNVGSAVASIEIIPELAVTIGMVGLPLDMINETSSAWYLLPEPPATYTQDDGIYAVTPFRPSFGAPDGLGLNLSGGYWKWFYSLSAVNGTESNYDVNPDMKMSLGFRTGFNILDPVPGSMTDFECSSTPKLTVNLGTMYQGKRLDPNTGADIKYLWTSTLGVGLRWGGFAFTTEGYYRKSKYETIGTAIWLRPDLTDIGYYAAAGYYIIPKKFEIAGQAGQIIRQGPENNIWQFGGGLNYYVFDNNLKLQGAYTMTQNYLDTPGGGTIPDENTVHNFSLMASAIF